MSAPFAARIVAPDRILFDGEAQQISCRTKVGEIGVLAHHISLVGALDTCRVKVYLVDGGEEFFAVRGGFVEVRDNKITLLSDLAIPAAEADADAAGRMKSEAQARIAADESVRDEAEADIEWADLLVELASGK